MTGALKTAGAGCAVGAAILALFFCYGDAGARTAPKLAAAGQIAGAQRKAAQAVAVDGPVLLFPGLDMDAITAISVHSPERSFQFCADGDGGVSVNGQLADREIYMTLVSQIIELPVDVSDAFSTSGAKLLLTLTVCEGSEQHTARFYEGDGTGEITRVVSGSPDAPEYGQTGGWRVGTLMMTCEGTRIQDERGNERPAGASTAKTDQP